MRCPYCGANNSSQSLYCVNCGNRLATRGNDTPEETTSKRFRFVAVVSVAALLVVAVTVGAIWMILRVGQNTTNAEKVVQTGYLGEYTDITVKELLDSRYGSSDGGLWSSGKNTAGKTIVQAKYQNRSGSMAIQFEMLNDTCFKVATLSVDDVRITEEMELLTVLNSDYYEVYTAKHNLDSSALKRYAERLDSISASSVAYGAEKKYRESRGRICKLDGKEPLECSATQLLYQAGYYELGTIWDHEEVLAEPEIEPVVTTPTVPKETAAPTKPPATTPTQNTTPPSTNSHEIKQGYVRVGIGELRIRSTPGEGSPEIGRLKEGTKVEILETTRSGSADWGRIERGWVCMDYIDLGNASASSSQSVDKDVRVKLNSGGLNIRGGPGTSYNQIGRLEAGAIVRITAIETVNGTNWGYIASRGWICMDYVDTDFSLSSIQAGGDQFVGNWGDFLGQRCFLTVTSNTSGTYNIQFKWGNSASSTSFWSAVGAYDEISDCIRYESCRAWESVSDGNGGFTDYVRYTDGQGKLYFSGNNLYWQDDKEDTGSRCCFERLD